MYRYIPKNPAWKKNVSFKRRENYSRSKITEYFSKTAKLKWQTRVLILFLAFVCMYFVYIILFSSYFKINQIIVEGNEEISTQEIIEKCEEILNKRRLIFFKNNNYFLFSPDKAEQSLAQDYLFNYLQVEKKYFSTLFIKLEERPYKLFYTIDNRNFLVDEQGILISQVAPPAEDEIIIKEVPQEIIINQEEIDKQNSRIVRDHPLYQDTNSTSTIFVWADTGQGLIVKEEAIIAPIEKEVYPNMPNIGDKFFKEEIIENILYLDYNYKEKFNYQRKYYEYQFAGPNFLILVTDNFKIYFKINEDLEGQISNLYRYLIEEGNKELDNIEYIDLRQKDQIIIK